MLWWTAVCFFVQILAWKEATFIGLANNAVRIHSTKTEVAPTVAQMGLYEAIGAAFFFTIIKVRMQYEVKAARQHLEIMWFGHPIMASLYVR